MFTSTSTPGPKRITSDVQKNIKVSGTKNSDILQGIKNGEYHYYTSTKSNDFINIDLQDEYFVKGIKLTLWHYDNRYYTYECWVSKDNKNGNELFSGYQARCNDTIIIMDNIRYIRLKGTNSSNAYLHIVNFKIY